MKNFIYIFFLAAFTVTAFPKLSFASEEPILVDVLNSFFRIFTHYPDANKNIKKHALKAKRTPARKLSDPYCGEKVIVIHVPVPNSGGATVPKYIFVDEKM